MADQYLDTVEKGLALHPAQASTSAAQVDALFWVLVAVCAALVLTLVGLVIWFSVRYRAGSDRPRPGGIPDKLGHRIELGGAAGLTIAFIALFAWAGSLYLYLYRDPGGDLLTINVIAKQWMWKLQHPNGAREINTLHVPTGQRVRLRITSQDVIHSLYIPAFRLKRDAVPRLYTTAWFEATEPGEYHLFCAEYCGTDHSRMRGKVVVMTPQDYADWAQENGEGESPARAGERLFTAYGCSGCHRGDGTVRAPRLDGIAGRPVVLASGGTVIADGAYLRDSILLPQKHVVAGYEPVMPSYQGQIGEDEILQIVTYLQSLSPGDWITESGG
ncbi:cytochrome c oxidase subunit II [uncultured Abyssibacter sp.]|uniref:cytochrome c oxidase subunit II n=1 Tax=uncultured Abyssibacter sp. TaxID=2320202 RepID=UPI0032B1F797